MSRLYNIINAIISPFGKELWSGTAWSTGTKTVTGSSKYAVFLIVMGGNRLLAFNEGGKIRGFDVSSGANSTTQWIHAFGADISGDVWTYKYGNELPHNQSSNHGSMTNMAVTKIVGLIPNWGGS